MEIEELLIKMGFNGEDVKSGILNTKFQVDGLKESFNHTFISAGTQTKAFKGLLHELADASPALGAAMKIAIDPLSGGLQTATAIFKSVMSDIKEWNTALDAVGKQAAKPFIDFTQAGIAAEKQIAAVNAQYDAWRKTLEDGKPGEAENSRIAERLRLAKQEAAGDDEAYQRRKIEIAQEEELAAKEKERSDLAAADAVNDALTDKDRIQRDKAESAALDQLIKRQEQLKELIAEQQAKVDLDPGLTKVSPEGAATGIYGTNRIVQETILNGLIAEREKNIQLIAQYEEKVPESLEIQKALELKLKSLEAETMSDKERADKMSAARQEAETALEDVLAKKRKENLKDQIDLAKAADGEDAVRFLQDKLDLENLALLEAQQNERKEEERQITNDILLTTQQLANAEARRVDMQAQFNYELSKAKEQRYEEVNSRYRPTLDQVSNSDSWNQNWNYGGNGLMPSPGGRQFGGGYIDNSPRETTQQWRTRSLREDEAFSGDSYLQNFSDKAKDFAALEEQAKIQFRMEGPNSTDYQSTLKQIATVREDLHNAGLLKEDPLKSIDEQIRKLVIRAEKEGLVIKPKNGA